MTPECYETQDYTMISKDLLSPQLGTLCVYMETRHTLFEYTCKLHFEMVS